MQYCYLNGKVVAESEARVGVLDVGLLRGYGIYEAMALVNGKVLRFADHAARFRKSADFLKIAVPVATDEELDAIILDLVEKNTDGERSLPRLNIKCILTGGKSIGGIDFDPSTPTFYVFLEEWKPIAEKYYTQGASVITCEHLRQYPQYKTTNYITAVNLQKDMRQTEALEILYTWNGNVLECATSNFFIVKDATLITAANNVLKGVTRNIVLELAKENGLKVEERDYAVEEMLTADEAFLTSSFKDVVPVVATDDKKIGIGLPGQTTKQVMRLFEEYVKAY